MNIRQAQLTDEKAIADICFETRGLDLGEAVDPELFGLRFALYYLHYEKEFCFVAEQSGQVIGYILSTPDTDKQEKGHIEHMVPIIKNRIPPDHPNYEILTTLHKRRDALGDDLNTYPAHLHINLTSKARSMGTGSKLLHVMEQNLIEHKVMGIHLGVLSTNTGAIRFYEKNGYQEFQRHAIEGTEKQVVFMKKVL